jgi:hypothetical protein
MRESLLYHVDEGNDRPSSSIGKEVDKSHNLLLFFFFFFFFFLLIAVASSTPLP